MSLFYSLDKMVGKDFELGLTRLKAVAKKWFQCLPEKQA